MITNEVTGYIEPGFPVIYNGDYNIVIDGEKEIQYPAGGLIADYMRLHPSVIKPLLMSCEGLNNKVTDNTVSDFIGLFIQKLMDSFSPVTGQMIALEFFHVVEDWITAIDNNQEDEYVKTINDLPVNNEIKKYIFADSGFDDFGSETIGQMFLSAYTVFSELFANTKYTFINMIKWGDQEEGVDESGIQFVTSLFTNMLSMQHIDFRIIHTEKGFESVYTIKSSMSLLAFEVAHWLDKNKSFVKCKNCGEYFIPDGRSDQIYCSYPSPKDPSKACRDIGAQIARANKEKSDVTTHEYRKVYMRYQMSMKRHPGNKKYSGRLEKLKKENNKWTKKLKNGTTTDKEYLDWLERFQEDNKC